MLLLNLDPMEMLVSKFRSRVDALKKTLKRVNLAFTCSIVRYFFEPTLKFLPSATDTTGNALCAVVRSMRITEETRETQYT